MPAGFLMLQRIGISLEDELLEQFDELISEQGYVSRSEAVRDLIRDRLVQRQWRDGNHVSMGVVVLVYDHHASDLSQRLAEAQHDHFANVISTLHVHVDHDNCLEVLVLKGRAREIKRLGDSLVSVRGVKHGQFVPATTGQGLQ